MQASADLSREERARAIYDLFQENPSAGGAFFKTLLLFAAIPLILLIAYRLQERARGVPIRRPVRLLWDLSGAASIGLRDRLLLIRMTRRAGLENPAVVLLSAKSYDRVAAEWVHAGHSRGAARLKRIRRRIFGD